MRLTTDDISEGSNHDLSSIVEQTLKTSYRSTCITFTPQSQ